MAQLFKIQDIQSGPSENSAMNVYWLDNPTGTNKTLEAVGNSFADQMVDLMRQVQSVNWEHIALLIEDVLTGTQALFNLFDYVGTRNSETTPASNAWSYSIKPQGPTIKRGGKRLVGVAEGDSAQDVAYGGMPTLLAALTPGFYVPILVGGINMNLATVRAVGNPVSSYIVSPNTAAIYRGIGTQVTRKLGRGSVATSLAFNPHETYDLTGSSFSSLSTDPDDWADAIDAILTPRVAAYTPAAEHTITL